MFACFKIDGNIEFLTDSLNLECDKILQIYLHFL